jgi:hypothetical protein
LTGRIFQNDGKYFIDTPSGQLLSWARDVSEMQFPMTYKFWADIVGVTLGFITIVGILLSINVWILLLTLGNGIIRTVWQYFKLKPVNKTQRELTLAGAVWTGIRSDAFENALNVKLNGNAEYEAQYLYDAKKPMIELSKKREYYERVRFLPTGILADFAAWLDDEPYWKERIHHLELKSPQMVYVYYADNGKIEKAVLGSMHRYDRKLRKFRTFLQNRPPDVQEKNYTEYDLRFRGQVIGRY